MRKELITIKGCQTGQEAVGLFIQKYCRYTPIVGHWSPKSAVDLMEKIEFDLVETHKRGKYKGKENHEHIFLVKYSYGR